MIDVEVLIDNFKDLKVYNQKITIIRNGKEKEIQFKLLQKGDIYKIDKSRYKALSEKRYVTKVIKRDSKED